MSRSRLPIRNICRGKKAVRMNRGGIIMGFVLDTIGKLIAGYLQKEVPGYEPFTPSDPEHLQMEKSGQNEPRGDNHGLRARYDRQADCWLPSKGGAGL